MIKLLMLAVTAALCVLMACGGCHCTTVCRLSPGQECTVRDFDPAV